MCWGSLSVSLLDLFLLLSYAGLFIIFVPLQYPVVVIHGLDNLN